MKFADAIFLLFGLVFNEPAPAQNAKPVVLFERIDFTTQDSLRLLNTYGHNKELVREFALPTLVALSYFPELKNTRIRLIFKPAHSPFTTRPVFPNLLS